MFSVGDEVVVVNDDPHGPGVPYPLRKGQKFTVIGVMPAGTIHGGWVTTTFCIQIGVEDSAWIEVCREGGWRPPGTFDLWAHERFRKVEKKRDRSELYALFGIDNLLTNKTPELTHG